MQQGWTLDRDKWKSLICAVGHTEWHPTQLDAIYRDVVPSESGVYLVCVTVPSLQQPPFSRLYNVIYAGQATDLKQRFLQHCRDPKKELRDAERCFGSCPDYWFTLVPFHGLDEAEGLVIACLGPPANLVGRVIRGRLGTPEPA